MIDPFTLIAVAAQIGVSIYNQHQNREITERIKREQREAKLAELQNNQRRDMERFQRSCQLQEQMESDTHRYKIETLKQDFINSFEKMIHKDNLETNYRLNISPYIIQRSVIPMTVENIEDTRQELFCVLTGSNDTNFNRDVLPYLDETICDILSKFWNESSNHTICYYQNVWDLSTGPVSNEDVENMKSLIPTPTVTLTPFFLNGESEHMLILKINVWRVGNMNKIAIDVETDIKFEKLPNKYTLDEINKIVDNVATYAVCSIGQISDVFYWTNFYQPPILPYLLGKNLLSVPEDIKHQYVTIYSNLYNQLAIGKNNVEKDEKSEALQVAQDVMEINMYNHPERSLGFLRNLLMISNNTSISEGAIRDSMLSFYRAKTDNSAKTLEDVDASIIINADVDYLSEYIKLAKQVNATNLVAELTNILKQKITSWR